MTVIFPIIIRIAGYLGEFTSYVLNLFTKPVADMMAENDMLGLGIYNPFTYVVELVLGDLTLLELMFTAGVGFVLLWGLIKFLLPTS